MDLRNNTSILARVVRVCAEKWAFFTTAKMTHTLIPTIFSPNNAVGLRFFFHSQEPFFFPVPPPCDAPLDMSPASGKSWKSFSRNPPAVLSSVSALTFWYVSWSPYTTEPGRLRCLAFRIAWEGWRGLTGGEGVLISCIAVVV